MNKHAKGIEFLFKKNKVESVTGWGRIAGPGRVSVEKDGKTTEIAAKNIMLATGSEARSLPGVKIDGKTILSNIEILELPAIPKSLVIVGAGAVGVEFASIFSSFGSEVTILEALPRVVPVEDEEISAALDKAFRKKRHSNTDRREGAGSDDGREGRDRDVHGFGRENAERHCGENADGRGSHAEDGKSRTGKNESENGTRVRAHRAVHGNGRAGALRHRRHRRGNAATGACRVHGRDYRGGEDVRETICRRSSRTQIPGAHIASRRSGRSG